MHLEDTSNTIKTVYCLELFLLNCRMLCCRAIVELFFPFTLGKSLNAVFVKRACALEIYAV